MSEIEILVNRALVKHETNDNLLKTLQRDGILLPSLCGGRKTCGRCGVRFITNAPLPSHADRNYFTPDKLREGYRLACTSYVNQTCEIIIPHMEEEINNQEIESNILLKSYDIYKNVEHEAVQKCFDASDADTQLVIKKTHTMLAVDLGTTTVAVALVSGPVILKTISFVNPQRKYGTDVMSRISAKYGHSDMKNLIIKEIDTSIQEMFDYCSQEEIPYPRYVVLAGNTTMDYLLLEIDPESLGKAPFEFDRNIFKTSYPDIFSGKDSNGNRLSIESIIIPPASAFVGGDIVAGAIAKKLVAGELLIDLGTNGEIVLATENGMLATATAAGPAFEGGSLVKGTASERLSELYELLQNGQMDKTGCLTGASKLLTQEDIRQLQMAKSAIACGIDFLLDKAKMNYDDVKKVYLAGGFGYYLEVEKAAGIGLIPREFVGKTIAPGSTALLGAIQIADMLLKVGKSGDKSAAINKVRNCDESENGDETRSFGEENISNEHVNKLIMEINDFSQNIKAYNLAQYSGFQEKFIENINF